MALIRDFQRRQNWLVNANGGRITELPPGSSTVAPTHYGIRTSLRDEDGNGGVPSGIPSERAELQAGAVGVYDRMQWWRWVERFDPGFPSITVDRWCIVFQFHGSDSAPQPYLAWEVAGLERRLNCNGGQSSPRYLGRWPLDRGNEVAWRMGVLWSSDPTRGRVVVYRNGRAAGDWTLRTAYTARVPYPKVGVYRNAVIQGETAVNVWGLQCFDADPGPFGTVTPPPPIPDPDPAPDPEPPPPAPSTTVTIARPAASQLVTGEVLYDVRVDNPPPAGRLYVGLAPAGVKATHPAGHAVGVLDVPDGMDATQWFYAAVHDQAGALVQTVNVPVNVDPVPTTPPPPDPPPPPPDPGPDPGPDPHVDLEDVAHDLDLVGTTLGATITLLEEAVRDVQAAVVMVQASAVRLRQ